MKITDKKILFPLLLISFACSNDNNSQINLCESQNFGVVKVTYGSSNVKHGLLITANPSGIFRDKITPIGIPSDTLHLKPGNYTLNIASLNNNNEVFEDETRTLSISKCENQNFTVTF